jgi:hypothetical protein
MALVHTYSQIHFVVLSLPPPPGSLNIFQRLISMETSDTCVIFVDLNSISQPEGSDDSNGDGDLENKDFRYWI